MKVIIINGSPRKKGLTGTILHKIESELLKNGVETAFYDLSELRISPCKGCCSCYKTGICYMEDDAESLSEQIRDSDGLVIGSPTYASNVSGLLKNYIDRGHFVIEQLLYNKFCITVSTGENYGYKDTLKVLNKLVLYSGGTLCRPIAVKAPFDDFSSVNNEIKRKCYKAVEKMLSGRRSVFQSIAHMIVFRVGIKPFVHSKGSAYQGVVNKWADVFKV